MQPGPSRIPTRALANRIIRFLIRMRVVAQPAAFVRGLATRLELKTFAPP